jgi:hypothetical protein
MYGGTETPTIHSIILCIHQLARIRVGVLIPISAYQHVFSNAMPKIKSVERLDAWESDEIGAPDLWPHGWNH